MYGSILKAFILFTLSVKSNAFTKEFSNRIFVFGILAFAAAMSAWAQSSSFIFAVFYFGLQMIFGYGYFKLLDKFQGTIFYWGIMILGITIFLFL